ncbi:MAG TPA: class I SAM-dependent methyltransferase, partial [Bacteroidia bacterium]|nr:class I SAM-dependent methyltransferase [Bacteroidia bacterium]
MKNFFFLLRYLRYRSKAVNEHGIHSPFVFKLVTEVFQNKNPFYAFKVIEKQRNKMLQSAETIVVEDFGAGSTI